MRVQWWWDGLPYPIVLIIIAGKKNSLVRRCLRAVTADDSRAVFLMLNFSQGLLFTGSKERSGQMFVRNSGQWNFSHFHLSPVDINWARARLSYQLSFGLWTKHSKTLAEMPSKRSAVDGRPDDRGRLQGGERSNEQGDRRASSTRDQVIFIDCLFV